MDGIKDLNRFVLVIGSSNARGCVRVYSGLFFGDSNLWSLWLLSDVIW